LKEYWKDKKDCLKDKKDCLKEAFDDLKQADDCLQKAREFYLQLCAREQLTSKQSISEKRKLTDIRDDLSASSSLAKFCGNGCWRNVHRELGDQIDCHHINMDLTSLSITLMHSVFAEFVQNCQSIQLSNESCTFAHCFCGTMQEDYKLEEKMAQVARDMLEEYLKVDLEVINITGSESDGSCCINGHLILNLEMKSQPGSGCNPSMENLAHYIKNCWM